MIRPPGHFENQLQSNCSCSSFLSATIYEIRKYNKSNDLPLNFSVVYNLTMGYVNLFATVVLALFVGAECDFQIGLGRADVTGPSVEIGFVSNFHVNFQLHFYQRLIF